MGTRILANFERTPSTSGLRLVGKPHNFSEDLLLEFPRSEAQAEKQDGLGCIRGIAAALGLQAVILILALAIWKLH